MFLEKCDRCGKTSEKPYAFSQLSVGFFINDVESRTYHICPECRKETGLENVIPKIPEKDVSERLFEIIQEMISSQIQ